MKPTRTLRPTPTDLRLALREFVKRNTVQTTTVEFNAKTTFAFVSTFFPLQAWFSADPARRKAALCTRRAGKSTALAGILVMAAMTHAFCTCIFLANTRKQAKRIMWKELLKLDKLYSLGIKFNRTDLTATLRNGSEIIVGGATDERDIDRLRGVPFVIAAIDEAGTFPPELLETLVYEVLGPATLDYDGTILMTGTPTASMTGLFYRVTTGSPDDDGKPTRMYESSVPEVDCGCSARERSECLTCRGTGRRQWTASDPIPADYVPAGKGWSVHKWSLFDNPYLLKAGGRFKRVADALLALREEEGLEETDPRYIREYLGRWTKDLTALVYPDLSEQKNLVKALPVPADGGRYSWRYGVSVDLGYDDPCAIALFAWCAEIPDVYCAELFSKSGMVPSQIAAKLLDLRRRCAIEQGLRSSTNGEGIEEWPASALDFVVVDQGGGSGKMVADEFRAIYGIPCEGAQKNEKETYLRFVNGDLRAGRLKIVAPRCPGLFGQLRILEWDPKKKGKENPAFPNDKADAFLYGSRKVRTLHFPRLGATEPAELMPSPGSKAAGERQAAIQKEKVRRQQVARQKAQEQGDEYG